jgi:4-oxalocrotonate tautomerase
MPIVNIHILEGRTPEQKKTLISEVTKAVSRSINSPPEKIKVLLFEIPEENWATAGVSKKEEKQYQE